MNIDDAGCMQAFSPAATIPVEQQTRLAMQRQLAFGWGTWYRDNALAATLLPEGTTLKVGICQFSTGQCLEPLAQFTPEQDRGEEESPSIGN